MVLNEKVCFVSGAARGRGNGRAIALKLAEHGASVAIGDIRFEEAEAVAKEIKALGCTALAVKMDLSNYDDVATGFAKIQEKLGPVDILVNNAAIMTNMATISAMKKEAWEREIAVNLSGSFFCVKQVFDSMKEKKWGRIINISSVAGIMGGFGQCTSPFKVVIFTCFSLPQVIGLLRHEGVSDLARVVGLAFLVHADVS